MLQGRAFAFALREYEVGALGPAGTETLVLRKQTDKQTQYVLHAIGNERLDYGFDVCQRTGWFRTRMH